MRSMVGGTLTDCWVPHDTRDEVIDYVNHWSDRAELPATKFIAWLGISSSKFYDWKERYADSQFDAILGQQRDGRGG